MLRRSADWFIDVFFRTHRRRPIALLIIFLLVFPVLLIAALSYLRTKQDLTHSEFSRRQTIAYLTAVTLKEKLDRMTDIGLALSTRVRFRQLAAAAQWDEAIEILAEVPKDFPLIERVFLSDPEGTLTADRPKLDGVVGKNFAHRDWYKGVSRNWEPYISEVYQRAAAPKHNVVAIALPIRGQSERPIVGILVLQVRLDAFLEWTKNIDVGPAGFVYFVDRKGHLVAHPRFPAQEQIIDFSAVPAVRKVLRGERGVEVQSNPIEREERLAAYEPVPAYGWGVIATQPTSAAFAAQRNALTRLIIIYGFILLLSGSFAYLILRTMEQREKIDAELREKNLELEKQSLRLQTANRLKDEFLANMSHELRTPLNGIIGFSELMHDGRVGPVSPEHREYLGDILSSARHLLQLINDILDLAKVEAGKMEFRSEPVNLEKIIGEVRDILRAIAASKRIRLEVQIESGIGPVVSDPAKLKQVLYNYLSNALKFTPDEGKATIRARPEGADAFRIEVEDTGIGIRDDDMPKLFVEFQQLDAGFAKKSQGTGLGLALCKRIIEAQGGSVGVQSRPGKGSIFYAVLPRLAGRKTSYESPAAALPLPSGTPTILIIEDNDKEREWLSRVLFEAGYAIETAATGAEALAKCQEKPFAAITLDLILPDMGGWDLFHSIRSEGLNKDKPVIVLTVVAEKEAAEAFPIWDYLVKPIQPEALLASLRRAGVSPGDGKRILVVDDDSKALKLAETALKSLRYRVLCVGDGDSGLRAAANEQFAAVVLDLLMPEMDGFEFLERFRRTSLGAHTPVIVWTNKEITARDRARLERSAQSIALKSGGGVDIVLRELKHYLVPAE